MARTDEPCFENLDRLGRHYRVPAQSKSAIPCEDPRSNTAKIKRSATCCSKCGKRKRLIAEAEERGNPIQNCGDFVTDSFPNTTACPRDEFTDYTKKCREPNIQPPRKPAVAHEETCDKVTQCSKHCHHQNRRNDTKVQCELAIDALNKKVSLVLEPCSQKQRRRSVQSMTSSPCRKHARHRHVIRIPCGNPKKGASSVSPCAPNHENRSQSEDSSCSKDRYPNRKHGNPMNNDPGKTDYSEVGKKIWQTMFEATEPTFVGGKRDNKDGDSCRSTPPRKARSPCRPPPRKVTWRQPHCSPKPDCRKAADPVMEHRIPDPCQASGKYIKMKFGKHFHLVELPERVDEPDDDEVQILFRQGKNVTWRKYKVFDK
ncbi:uncharacterized protein LOC129590123 [Paramacrobiotus metropolitanus]|uniref:uncharacterized protein LOC129590123 n=1 Tax=Paramacrobiotus metropolitanus TaxID=2943436 RepID=UPI002445F4AD|nr:uncharacterized protein LOC129590123 [Paramacrobiotus metropolitanus]